ncbi:16041_t:CDS:2, partial [Acaulospora colombiana]
MASYCTCITIVSSSLSEGTRVKVLEEDDGSGWIKIFKESTEKSGLVPASYLKLDNDEDSEDEVVQPDLSMPVPNVTQVSRSGKYGDDELALAIGEQYELTSGEHGGEHYGEGWWEGINAHGKQGIFPSNYVSDIAF